RRLRQEAAEAQIPDNKNQVWILSPEGHPLATLETCNAALCKQLVDFLEQFPPELRPEESPPLILPGQQSRRPSPGPDAVVLHWTSRYLERKGLDYVLPKVELGRNENYHNQGVPSENWIVLERGQWTKLLGRGAVQVGSSWEIDPQVTATLFRHMY